MFLLNVTALGVRLLGFYVLLKAWMYERDLGEIEAQIDGISAGLPDALSLATVLMLIVAALLVFLPVSIARMLLPKTATTSPALGDGAHALEICAYTVIGIYMLASATPALFEQVVYVVVSEVPGVMFGEAALNGIYISMGATVVQMLIGVWLVLGASGISDMVKRLRRAGQPQP